MQQNLQNLKIWFSAYLEGSLRKKISIHLLDSLPPGSLETLHQVIHLNNFCHGNNDILRRCY
jgi:hypothetical protein